MKPHRILLFATLQRAAGVPELPWVPETSPATAQQAWEAVCRKFPALRPFETGLLIAVDQVFAPLSTLLPEGAEVAFMPPVQGG